MFKKNRPGMFINEQAIGQLVASHAATYGNKLCLDVGAGAVCDDNYISLDISDDYKPDVLGDIKTIIDVGASEPSDDMKKIAAMKFMLIRMHHVVEHIEWIYQKQLFHWAFNALLPGGIISIDTPNFEYIVGVYLANRRKQLYGKKLKYPVSEHSYLNSDVTSDMQWWANFKLFSGCSPGDYHHSIYDRQSLCDMLSFSGCCNIRVYDGLALRAVGYKKEDENMEVTGEVVRRAIS